MGHLAMLEYVRERTTPKTRKQANFCLLQNRLIRFLKTSFSYLTPQNSPKPNPPPPNPYLFLLSSSRPIYLYSHLHLLSRPTTITSQHHAIQKRFETRTSTPFYLLITANNLSRFFIGLRGYGGGGVDGVCGG